MLNAELLWLLASGGLVGLVLSLRLLGRWRRRGRPSRVVGRVLEGPAVPAIGGRAGEELVLASGRRPWRVLLGGAPVELGRRPRRIKLGDWLIVIGDETQRGTESLYREVRTDTVLEAHRVSRAPGPLRLGWPVPAALAASVLILTTCAAAHLMVEPIPSVVTEAVRREATYLMCPDHTEARGRIAYDFSSLRVYAACGRPDGTREGPQLLLDDGHLEYWELRGGEEHGLHLLIRDGALVQAERYVEGRLVLEQRFDERGRPVSLSRYEDGQEGEHREWEGGIDVVRGQYRHGLREGRWVLHRDCPCPDLVARALRCAVQYRADQLEGPAEWSLEGGGRMAGTYREGKAIGPFKVWREGVLEREGPFRENVRDGRWVWYRAGREIRRGHYRLGERHGRWVELAESGDEKETWYLRDRLVTRTVFEAEEPAALAAY